MKTINKKLKKSTKVAKEVQPEEVAVTEELTLDLENEEGILARVDKTNSRETHIRYVSFDGGKTSKLDIRQYIMSEKYTGYSSKGLTIPESEISAFRDYINQLADAILEGKVEPTNQTITK